MPNQTISPGDLLAGRYRIAEQLAEYAGAGVWRAVDEVLSRAVVVDVLGTDDPRASRLHDAARRAATAADSRFLRVLDCAVHESVTYCVREWANGRPLERMLAAGPLTGQQAGWLAREVSESLELLHRSGLQHGAISPATVIVTDTGAIKIVGVATEAALRREDGPGSPEEDIRDLGRVLYAALTARWPGPAAAYGLAPAPLEHGRLMSPRQVRAGVPRSLDDIADRLLGTPPRHHATPVTSAAGLSAALAGVIGHSHEPPSQINDDAHPIARQEGSVDDATVLSPVVAVPPALDPSEPTAVHPVAAAGRPTTTAQTPHVPSATERPVRRQSANGASTYGSNGDGNGRRKTPKEPRERGGWGGRILILLAVLALLSVIAMAQFLIKPAINDARDSGKEEKPPPATSAPPSVSPNVKIVKGTDFDPEPDGNGEEHGEDVPKTYDGKAATTWTTMSYKRRPDLGGTKDGVGIVYDLGSVTNVSQVTVALRGGATDLEIRVPKEPSGSPAKLDGWEQVAAAKEADETAVLKPAPGTRSRYVLVWLTKLPKEGSGYRGEIAEVTVQR